MVIQLALDAGLSADSLYFNIEKVGNASSASIPLAIHDAVRDGVIKRAGADLRARVRGRRRRWLLRDAHRSGHRGSGS